MRVNGLRAKGLRTLHRAILFVAVLLLVATVAQAAGPRWVSGPPYFAPTGFSIAWFTNHPTYYTDLGDLSPMVDHAAAEALVARAAAVWNVPQSSLVLAQGGSLDEHVTGASIAATGGLPADVRSTNWQAKPIAVIYDTDGSVIDALLGAGGSDPSGCLQNGVVESVDAFGTNSTIQHAVLVLNGRCTGANPDAQTQMQYQLVRAFGRVLGLGWSQTNDNVFTNTPTPTKEQAANWPIMHPVDVICGPYTFTCMPDPFTLRPDDISSLTQLYYLWQGQGAGAPGKEDTLRNASQLDGYVSFPNGQGMEGVNVTVRRRPFFSPTVEGWQTVSAVSGFSFRRQTGTPVTPQGGSALESIGTYEDFREGYWRMERIPIPAADPWQTLVVTTEAVNPLYTGSYALSTMAAGSMTIMPSGSAMQLETDIVARYYFSREQMTIQDAVGSCAAVADGTEDAPVAMAKSGWWTGVLCGYAHSAWTTMPVKANRSLTVEVTALDAGGRATAAKAMPMIGVWQATDALGVAPTVAATPVAFNSFGIGLSSTVVNQTAAGALRMAVVDQRGAGRPDFAYQSRVLYADALAPVNVGANGGQVVISGTGFRAGNAVLVNGVAATVTAVQPTSITATVPSLRALGSTRAMLATVTVRDVTTGGTSTMQSALGYASPQERLQLVSAPTGTVVQGVAAATAFAVQVLGPDGVTPLGNQTVTFAVLTGYATFGVCGQVSCTTTTDARGVATTSVTPTTAGTVGLKASTSALSVQGSFNVVSRPDVFSLVSAPSGVATVGSAAAQAMAVRLVAGDGVTPRVGATVTIAVTQGRARLEACGAQSCSLKTDANGLAATAVVPTTAGAVTIAAVSAAGNVAASFTAAMETIRLVSAPVGVVTAGTPAGTMFVVQVVGGDGVSPVAGEAVVLTAMGGAVRFAACGGATCTVMTDARGMAGSALTAAAAGTVVVSAAATSGAVTASFRVATETMQLVSAPTGEVTLGTAATTAFAVRVLAVDGVSPVAGETVQFHVAAGTAVLGVCGGAACDVVTDATGTASVTVTPLVAGAVMVVAESAAGSQSATVTGRAMPAVVQVIELPAGAIFAGDVLQGGFAVQLLMADGRTPVVGAAVSFSVSAGVGSFAVCGGASCVVKTDANGVARTGVTAGAAGVLTLTAQAAGVTGTIVQAVSVSVGVRVRMITATQPVVYVAEGTTATWMAQVALSDNSAVTDGLAVSWTGAAGLSFAGGSSAAAAGMAAMPVRVSGVGAGVRVQGKVCAWGSVCGALAVQGVSAAEWQMVAETGAGQQVGAASTLAPVTLRVVDQAGHPVVGATVNLYQAVTAWQQGCADHGRCPAPEVLKTSVLAVTTDADGRVSVAPAEMSGAATVTQMTATTGTQGSVTLVLVKRP